MIWRFGRENVVTADPRTLNVKPGGPSWCVNFVENTSSVFPCTTDDDGQYHTSADGSAMSGDRGPKHPPFCTTTLFLVHDPFGVEWSGFG
jgi:hypothetical protein